MAAYRTLDGGDGYLSFEEVFREEQDYIRKSREQRAGGDAGGARFSLAFSGGGIRAAAFQAGVLWRLAEQDLLKDVDYFTAVSGGGYITSAFASHCLGAGAAPKSEKEVKAWYLDVVAKTLCRMQRNAGDFVRDCVSAPGLPQDGSGYLPRCLDLPILLATLALTLVVLPLFFFACILVPFAISVELFFGSAMRGAFCQPASRRGWKFIFWEETAVLLKWSPYWDIILTLIGAFVALFVFYLLRKVLPCCRLQPPKEVDGRPVGRQQATRWYLCSYAAEGFLKRFIICLIFMVVLPYYVAVSNSLVYSPAEGSAFCEQYVRQQRTVGSIHGGCAEFYPPEFYPRGLEPWWKEWNVTARPLHATDEVTVRVSRASRGHVQVLSLLLRLFVFLALVGVFIAPLCGTDLLKRVIFVLGPVLLFILTAEFTQFRVFGPVTGNAASRWLWQGVVVWDKIVLCALMVCIFCLPFLAELRATFHYYYRRSLRENYFHNGKDVPMQDLANSPYCPFVIMTGTACDYKPPGELDSIAEISFSALHCGGEETGYVRMPFFQSLSSCTALTGAGCLDAISLTMSDLMTLRFWLEVSNLTWGDYIFFQPEGSSWLGRLKCLGKNLENMAAPKLLRTPSFVPLVVVYSLFFAGWHEMLSKPHADCRQVRLLFRVAIMLAVAIVGLSFFTFLPGCNLLSMSPLIRRVHQLSMYFYRGNHPPQMLYVTDGGVKDCTSILQLLLRRRERILLVLAAADPRDELGVLKSAMQVAKGLRICSFYDPEDPRRDIDLLFLKYKEDKDMPYLHLGISYCWDEEDGGLKTGHLFVVKNRLPSRCTAQPIKPLVMEEEIRGEARAECDDMFSAEWKGMTTDKLGPFGCCDCCHTHGLNCGPKFPHGSFAGYLYLSPQWCNSLMRLGYEVSADAVAGIASKDLPAAGWEAHVKPS